MEQVNHKPMGLRSEKVARVLAWLSSTGVIISQMGKAVDDDTPRKQVELPSSQHDSETLTISPGEATPGALPPGEEDTLPDEDKSPVESDKKRKPGMPELTRWLRRCWYPAHEPLAHTRMFWIAMGIVTIAVISFCAFFIAYLLARHDALQTTAEDLGIMDQAIWSTLHGNILHQTICNSISDTNCYSPDGIMRFAIHVEPILFPISLLYALWPTPKTLLVVQTLIVASGAFPAFWLARLRLRNELAAVAVALLYLLYPAQQQATVFDFHAVTLTAAFLLFMLYFLYTRRTGLVFLFAILAMACKEEIPLVVACIGIWSMLFQHRWRSGGALALLGLVWVAVLYLYVIPSASPTGHALLEGRYQQLGDGPVQVLITVLTHPVYILRTFVLEHAHSFYIRLLLSPAAYIPILAPWILVMAAPTLALNLFSSFPNMYSGQYQYNAEIVPVLIFATIEGVLFLCWLIRIAMKWLHIVNIDISVYRRPPAGQSRGLQLSSQSGTLQKVLIVLLFSFMLLYAARNQYKGYDTMPFAPEFSWPQATSHTMMASQIMAKIPADASVSAQTTLVPHLSERHKIYQFPYGDDHADYIMLDITANRYPFISLESYTAEIQKILDSGTYGLAVFQDGYVLFQQGLPPPKQTPDWLWTIPEKVSH